jgi:HTH-type transcriptional regulator/antitoxin HigA
MIIQKEHYEFALAKVEELLPLVGDDTPSNNKNAIELTLMSEIVISYEKEHFPIMDTCENERNQANREKRK